MKVIVFLLSVIGVFTAAPQAHAQQAQVWVQIEARPTLPQAEERARAYASLFPDVQGFRLNSGWYAIVLGPYAQDSGVVRLTSLLRERLVPNDSFIADGRAFRAPFYPLTSGPTVAPVTVEPLADAPGTDPLLAPLPDPDPSAVPEAAPEIATLPEAAPIVPQATEVPVLPEETPAEARRSEAALSREDRQALQTALQWFGHYNSAIDGAFGPGTRNSMAAWQQANGVEPTGILTTRQRDLLLAAYGTAQAELGLQTVNEAESGIEITLPMALVQFDHYEPPFVHYVAKDNSGVRVILISEPGDQAALYGLYDVLQTLSDVPAEGERSRGERSFTISARSAAVESYSYAETSKGLVKGFMLIWNPRDGEKMNRVLAAMQASFKSVGDRALDPGLVPLDASAKAGLLSGLEVRRPELSRSGFYVDAKGSVLTTVEAVQNCTRITLDRDTDAALTWSDAATGLAVLTPKVALAPARYAQLQTAPARIGGEVAVAGYSYEDRLPSPSLTFGTLAEAQGLDGEPGLSRLTLTALGGDAGGPVLDGSGAVVGMLLPRVTDAARQLPRDVAFAANVGVLTDALAKAGVTPAAASPTGALAPEDLTALAVPMTVLVSCWN